MNSYEAALKSANERAVSMKFFAKPLLSLTHEELVMCAVMGWEQIERERILDAAWNRMESVIELARPLHYPGT
jgi:hypothetical protein